MIPQNDSKSYEHVIARMVDMKSTEMKSRHFTNIDRLSYSNEIYPNKSLKK